MTFDVNRHNFWLCILTITDDINQQHISIEQLVCMLTGIEEGYRSSFDPADSFQEYAVLELCKSIKSMLDAPRLGH